MDLNELTLLEQELSKVYSKISASYRLMSRVNNFFTRKVIQLGIMHLQRNATELTSKISALRASIAMQLKEDLTNDNA